MPSPLGQRFSRLTVIAEDQWPRVLFLCDCGNNIRVNIWAVKHGNTKSCGCLKRERDRRPRSHGYARTPEHNTWLNMRQRCYNPNASGYHGYGGRGIKVCERWKRFEHFLADMGPRPSSDYSIDRVDNNGNYEPSNCRWVDTDIQRRNTRRNILFTFHGITMTVGDWAAKQGLKPFTVYSRINRDGWSPEEALGFSFRDTPKPRDRNELGRFIPDAG